MPSTIRDVARSAGVSPPTVSRVLANKENVDPILRARVLDAVRLLDYRPHRAARALRRQVTRTIAFIIPDIQNPFFTSVLRGVEDAAFADDYVVMLCNTDDSLQRQRDYIAVLRAENVAGMAICPADETSSLAHIASLQEQGTAVVVVDRLLPAAGVDTVLSDNVQGAQQAVSHLLRLGHRRIGLIAGPDYFAPGRERRQGYERAHQQAGAPVDASLIKVTDFRPDAAAAAARELLALPAARRPTALFASSSRLALGALAVIGELRLCIPEDISFVGFDDAEWTGSYTPQLTVVAQPTYEIGSRACRMLLARIADPDIPPGEVRLPTSLVERRSCRALVAA
jgi:DNA-binding LacI/PurR family transcriptional regulator